MSEPDLLSNSEGARCLVDGGVIAYPTEAVYGLGCDPDRREAVLEILELKDRPASAGLILVSDRFERFEPYIGAVEEQARERALATWPGPVTWLFPRAASVPDWLAGVHATIALRITAHPGCIALCEAFGKPIVSTSANPSAEPPARSAEQVLRYFPDRLCGVVEGDLGGSDQPSEIRDLASGRVIRAG